MKKPRFDINPIYGCPDARASAAPATAVISVRDLSAKRFVGWRR
jgi:hypothetical protein